jgi:pilus assembly protein CpaC
VAATAQISGTVEPKAGETLTLELNEGQLVRLDRPAASVFISNPTIADVNVRSTQLVYLLGRAPGKTTLFALDSQDNVIVNMEVVVHHNLARLREALDTLLPTAGLNVTSIEGGIILSGTVGTGTDAENARRITARFIGSGEEVINQLAVTEPNQVNLRVRVAEVKRNILNKFGINMDVLLSGNPTFSLFTNFSLAGVGGTFAEGSGTSGDLNITGILDAMADDGLLTVLAEPNLTALSGENASFHAGGEFPVQVPQAGAGGATIFTTEFHPFGVTLSFTPTVVGENRIHLFVNPEVSSLDFAVALSDGTPGRQVRRTETTVELGSGQSFAIAGLLSQSTSENIFKTPGLGDIPILGALFKSEQYRRNETELVIIVTPYLVRPVSKDKLPLPTDPFTRPQPSAMRTQKTATSQIVPIPSGASSAMGQTGSAGYILD